MRISIRSQLLLPLLALMLGLVGVSTWSAYSSGQRARRQIETQIDNIAATVSARYVPIDNQILRLLKGLSGAEFLLCDHERKPARDPQGEMLTTLSDIPDNLPMPSESPTQHFDKPVLVGKTSYLCGGVTLPHATRPGTILYIFYPESLWRDAVWEALSPALTLGIVGGIISIILGVAMSQQISGRVLELERRTRLIADGDLSPMPLPSRNDELRDLSRSVNEMAQRLAELQETIRQTERLRLLGQVSGGLAHQLRNGVAGARLAVQLHEQECAQEDHESLAVALRQLSLVEMHLKRFLDLGKTLELQKQPCELGGVVRETADLVRPQSKHAQIDLRVVPSDIPITLTADASQLGQLILNVLTNAIEAAGPGGWVEVRWGQTKDRAFIEIRDSGPGPSPDVAARLFEPFVTGKREGVGLGLAVARQVAEAHGGSIAWSRDARGTCFRIELDATMESP